MLPAFELDIPGKRPPRRSGAAAPGPAAVRAAPGTKKPARDGPAGAQIQQLHFSTMTD
jgi:hypothetical protein